MVKKTVPIIIVGLLLSASTLIGAGCVADLTTGGPVVSRQYDITGFTAVQVNSSQMGREVYHRFVVDIVPSDTCAVSVTANDNLLKHVYISKSGSTLRIQLRNVQVSFSPATLQAHVAMPELRQITASGAAEVTAHGFESDNDFVLDISDGARVDVDVNTAGFNTTVKGGRASGIVNCHDARIGVFGLADPVSIDGTAEFAGSAASLVLRGGVGADITLHEFPVSTANVTLSGMATRADVTVNGRLNVNLIGGGSLSYSGNVTLGDTFIGTGSFLRERSW